MLEGASKIASVRRDRDERTGQGLGVHGAPAGWRGQPHQSLTAGKLPNVMRKSDLHSVPIAR